MVRSAPGPSTPSGQPVSDSVIALAAAAGVRETFAVAGGALTPILASLAAQDPGARDWVRYVGVRHEFAAATMAAAVYQSTGRLALCLGEQGPGTLNLISGLGGAYNNRLAVLAVTVSGNSVTSGPGSGAVMELAATVASQAVTKWRHQVRHADEVAGAVSEAIRQATMGRPGPVHVDIARDVIAAVIPTQAVSGVARPERGAPTARTGQVDINNLDSFDNFEEAVALLLGAQRLLVIAGGGATAPAAARLTAQLAEHLGAVTAGTQMGMGVFADDGPTYAGHGGVIGGPALIRAAQQADVVLAVGCRLSSWWWQDGEPLTKAAAVVHIDTDPAVLSAVSLLGDSAMVLGRLWSTLGSHPRRSPSDWALGIHGELSAHRQDLAVLAGQTVPAETSEPAMTAGLGNTAEPARTAEQAVLRAHPAALAQQLADLMDPSDLVVLDGGHTTFWSNDFVRVSQPRTVFHEPGMAQLGFGIPYANALAAIHPDRRVVTITGDGAFGFSIMELDTARRLGLRTITVIHNNAEWGVIGLAQRRAGFSLGTDLAGTDYAAIADGFGCLGLRVSNLTQLPAAWTRARAAAVPVVLDVLVRFEPHPMMPAFGRSATPATPSG